MRRRKTTEEYIADAIKVHGDKYNYSEVKYVNCKADVLIKCNTCGKFFLQGAYSHLRGHGCPHCSKDKKPQHGGRKIVCGVGIFDAPYSKTKDSLTKKAYRDWNNMLQRCYGTSDSPSKKAYKECTVCEEWYSFLNFRKWFDENYIEGCFLDKDILVKGNKIYSPNTCSYVPPFINTLLINCRSARGEYPIGVHKQKHGFSAKMWKQGEQHYIGFYKNEKDAFLAYKKAKEDYVKSVAQKYYDEGKITERVYDALMKYEVEITD